MGITDEVNLVSSPSKLVTRGKEVCLQRHETRRQNEEIQDIDKAQSTSAIRNRHPVQNKESAECEVVRQSLPATNTLQSATHTASPSIALHQENTVPVGNSPQNDVCVKTINNQASDVLTPPRRSSRQRSTNLITLSSTDANKHEEILVAPQGEGGTQDSLV